MTGNEFWQQRIAESKAERQRRTKIIREYVAEHGRPTCSECGEPLPVYRFFKEERRDFFGYCGNGVFCTATCGFRFGLAAHDAGFRRRK